MDFYNFCTVVNIRKRFTHILQKCPPHLIVPVADILNILRDVILFSLYLMNFMFYTMLDAAYNIQGVHYKSMKFDDFLFTR